MPMITATPAVSKYRGLMPRLVSRAEGTFTGVFAEKNETGYNILGSISGDYSMGSGPFGSFSGAWEMDDESAEGEFSGYIVSRFFVGQYNITGSEQTGQFIGLFKVNETEFKAISLVFTGENHLVRYALGTIDET
jgi:hypothetical protein